MRDPYEVLGIKKTSSKDEIKKRFDILLRRYKAYKSNPEYVALDFDMDEINAAYNNIMGYDIKEEDPNAGRKRPFLKLLKIDPGKFDNFWLYNKTKIIIGTVSLVVLISIIFSLINHVPIDFNMKVLGEIYVSDEVKSNLQEELNLRYNEIEKAYIDLSIINAPDEVSIREALIQRFMVDLDAKAIDIIVCDKDTYSYYLRQGIFMNLDGFLPKELLENNEEYYFDGIIFETERITGHFGINVSKKEFFKDFVNTDESEELIICVVFNTERLEIVKSFFDDYVVN